MTDCSQRLFVRGVAVEGEVNAAFLTDNRIGLIVTASARDGWDVWGRRPAHGEKLDRIIRGYEALQSHEDGGCRRVFANVFDGEDVPPAQRNPALLQTLDAMAAFRKDSDRNILVHCLYGEDRSAFIAFLHLLDLQKDAGTRGVRVDEALRDLLALRSRAALKIHPSAEGFRPVLQERYGDAQGILDAVALFQRSRVLQDAVKHPDANTSAGLPDYLLEALHHHVKSDELGRAVNAHNTQAIRRFGMDPLPEEANPFWSSLSQQMRRVVNSEGQPPKRPSSGRTPSKGQACTEG